MSKALSESLEELLLSNESKVRGVFFSLPEAMRERLLCNKKPHYFQNNEYLQHYNDENTGVWVIKNGFVRIGRAPDNDLFQMLGIVASDDSFGELSCFSERRRPIDAMATGNVTAYSISYDEFKAAIEEFPESNDIIRRVLASQLQQAIDIIMLNKLQDAKQKLRWNMKFYCSGNPGPIKLLFSQNELAYMIGVSRMTVSSVFKELEQAGIIRREYGNFLILKPELL